MSVPFSFYNFTGLVDLHRGIVDRQNDTRLEAFSILYCDFTGFDKDEIDQSLQQVVRASDSYVHNDSNYFFILYQTDMYGGTIVADMFVDFFGKEFKHHHICFPKHGENTQELFDSLQVQVKNTLKIDLECLDTDTHHLEKV